MSAMDTPEHDYGRAVSIDAEAIGRPGQRRFRLLVRGDGRSACLWMEKQQLGAIGEWMTEVLERLDKDRPTPEPPEPPGDILEPFELDFRASQIGLGYAEDANLFAIQAFDSDLAIERESPSFRCFLNRGQCRFLSRKIAEVVAGGRPICPLCELPMEPEGHVCPKSNGHHLGAG
ncbi:MAG: DUF3090 family protein [Dehalococcoidia bacterium]|nr:DUF3090 family protein [Dehalococcoidia bacterium]